MPRPVGLDPPRSGLTSPLHLFSLPVAVLCSVLFHPALNEQVEEISTFSRTQKSNLCLQRWSAHPTYCTCICCSFMLSESAFRLSCHDGATEMRDFQAVLERPAKSVAYTLLLSQLCRYCLYGCTKRKKNSMGGWETWHCLAPACFRRSCCSQKRSPALLQMWCAPDLVCTQADHFLHLLGF